ncbi:16745_t:CDS:1, partial [Gigaspora rosea]
RERTHQDPPTINIGSGIKMDKTKEPKGEADINQEDDKASNESDHN